MRMLQANLEVIHRFTFDRVSGAFQESVSFNDKGALIHYGMCVRTKPVLKRWCLIYVSWQNSSACQPAAW
jgi:hypothetical protein